MSDSSNDFKKSARKTGWLFNVAGGLALAANISTGEGLFAFAAVVLFLAGVTYFVKSSIPGDDEPT